MKPSIIFPLIVLASLISCNNKKATTDEAQTTETTETATTLNGKWRLADCAGTEEMMVFDGDADYVLTFNPEDSTFTINTDCNTIGGKFYATADSLLFTDTYQTLMNCPDASAENAINAFLPVIDNYVVVGDSVLILRANGRQYATLTAYSEE